MRLNLATVEGKVIGCIDNSMPNGNSLFDDMATLLTAKYKVARTVCYRKEPGGETPEVVLNALVAECDAIIVGMANSGAPTSWSVRDSLRAAAAGRPVALLGTDEFRELAQTMSTAIGHADLPMVTVRHPFTKETREEVRAIANSVTDELVGVLLDNTPTQTTVAAREGNASFIDVPDDLTDFNRLFFDNGWGDGLPLIPPTPDLVERMLRHARRDPREVVAVIPPYGTATVEAVAVIAVMAGCRPEYLPVLLAATEAIGDKQFELFFLQNTIHPTTTWLLVNGPIARRLEVSSGANCLGPGAWANATLGRALRLTASVIGGARSGEVDMSTLGWPGKFLMCCAENEAASPWEPFHVERGFAPDASTVTVIAAKPMLSFTTHTQDVDDFLRVISNAMTGVTGSEYRSGGAPTLVLSPEHAQMVARAGLSKSDFKRRVWETARLPVSKMGARDRARTQIDRREELGEFGPDTLLTPSRKPEDIIVLVAGGWGMLSSYVPCHAPISWPVIRAIDEWMPAAD
jgi:hypothetical protein